MPNPIDDITKKEITDKAYVVLRPYIIIKNQSGDPDIVMSAENKEYYKEELTMADSTYIQLLIDHGKINLLQP